MKKSPLILFLFFILPFMPYSQTSDTITSVKVFGGYRFEKEGKILTPSSMIALMKGNPEALELMKSAKSNYDIANVFACAGGFMIGWPIGTAIGGGKPEWLMLAAGCGLVAISLPICKSASNKANKAISLYNNAPNKTSFFDNYSLNLSIKTSGASLILKF